MALTDFFSIARARLARPYSRLLVVSDGADWVLRYEAGKLAGIARTLGISAAIIDPPRIGAPQCFHFTSQFALINPRMQSVSRRMSVDFFHGSSQSHPHFGESLTFLKHFSGDVLRIRVSNKKVHEWLLSEGISAEHIHRIPIGIDTEVFSPATQGRGELREHLGLPADAFVVGSFQKDGVGWGKGMDPKMIKGPDVFLAALQKAKHEIPNLWVLLSGPSRGYVMAGLKRLGIPFRREMPKRPEDVAPLYHALDAYLISARDEGGPKGFLESLASGIPCVSTRVGQVVDLATDTQHAFLSDIEDADGLAGSLVRVSAMSSQELAPVVAAGRALAEKHSYQQQHSHWERFFSGYVLH